MLLRKSRKLKVNEKLRLGVIAEARNPSTQEAEAGRSTI